MRCVYCQNWDISWGGEGREVSTEELADIMLRLQAAGCHNINFVTPSHVVAQIIAAVDRAAAQGLSVPLVYNTGGYDSPEALALFAEGLRFIAEEISPHTYLNVMDRYRPRYRAGEYPELDRPITRREFHDVLEVAELYGLRRVDYDPRLRRI